MTPRRLAAVPQASTPRLVVSFLDADGSAIAESNLTALTLTYRHRFTGTVINSRNAQSVLDANGGTVATDGTLTWQLVAAETPITDTTRDIDEYEALIRWTYDSGARAGAQVFIVPVINTARVP